MKRKYLSTKQEHAIQVLADKPWITQAALAAEVGVRQQTISAWVQDSHFAFRMKRKREEWEGRLSDERLASKRQRMRILHGLVMALEEGLKAVEATKENTKGLTPFAVAKTMFSLQARLTSQIASLLASAREEMKGPEILQPVYPEAALKVGNWMIAFADNLVDDASPWEVNVDKAGQVTLHEAARVLLEIGERGSRE
jgi:DNA-binding XRE family transcriptional regulator